MKRLLLPLLAALAFPTAVNANTYDDMLMRTRWPQFIENYNNGVKFQEIQDFQLIAQGSPAHDLVSKRHLEIKKLYP